MLRSMRSAALRRAAFFRSMRCTSSFSFAASAFFVCCSLDAAFWNSTASDGHARTLSHAKPSANLSTAELVTFSGSSCVM